MIQLVKFTREYFPTCTLAVDRVPRCYSHQKQQCKVLGVIYAKYQFRGGGTRRRSRWYQTTSRSSFNCSSSMSQFFSLHRETLGKQKLDSVYHKNARYPYEGR